MKPSKKDAYEMEHEQKQQQLLMHSRREPSPELARFSALVTRPPKQKTPSTSKSNRKDYCKIGRNDWAMLHENILPAGVSSPPYYKMIM